MKKILFGLLLTIFHFVLFSQGIIRGNVTDKQTHQALAGATIAIKGASTSVITDNEGDFLLHKIKRGKITLTISYVGYETTEIPVEVIDDSTSLVNTSLNQDAGVGSTVVVTASKHPEKITNAPASISVIGEKDFNEFAGSNINELVSKIQGVQYTRSGVDWITFNARNFNSAFNNKVLQLVDGRLCRAALSGGLPMFNMGSYIKDDIERMEIVFGPQTALYGANALNAVFNSITKDPRKYQGTTVALSAGNHYQFSGRIRHAQRINNKWAYKLNGEYVAGKDYVFYDSVYVAPQNPKLAIPERNVDFNFRHIRGEGYVYYSLTPKTDIIVSGGLGENNFLQVTNGGRNQMRGVYHGFLQGRLVHPNYFINIYNTWGSIGKSYPIPRYTTLFWTLTQPPNPLPPDIAESKALILFKEKSQRLNLEAQYNHTFQQAGLFIVGGIDYQKEKPNGFGVNLIDKYEHIYVTQYGAVLQLEKALRWSTRLIGAMRYDHHSNFGNFFSPKFGLVKSVGEGSFRVTWGKSYGMPSILSQYANIAGVYFGNGIGITYWPNGTTDDPSLYKVTKPLRPEEVSTWEIGYKGTIAKKLFFDVSYYDGVNTNFGSTQSVDGRAIQSGNVRVANETGFVDTNGILNDAFFLTDFNYGQVRHFGLDLDVTYSINKYINLGIKYSWFGSDITADDLKNDANGDQYVSLEETSLNAPKNKGAIVLNFQDLCKKNFFINFLTRFVQSYDFYSGNQIGTEAGKGSRGKVYWGEDPMTGQSRYYLKNFDWGPLGGFVTIDLGAGYKLNNMVSLNMNITNLLDSKQIESVGSPSIGRLIMFELKVHVPNSSKEKK